ncbi:MAG: SUMF1/EgtB/PvdO family nonheme iron enzyme [Pseudomonadota bacterium]
MMEEIFISYKSERRPAVAYFAEILRAHGFSVWFDYGLLPGKNFGVQIEEKLRAAKVALVLWCPLSVTSDWVQDEADLAKELGILHPVRLAECNLPMGFRRDQYIDLSGWDGDPRSAALDDLMNKLGNVLAHEAAIPRQAMAELEQYWIAHSRPTMLTFEQSAPLNLSEGERRMPSAKRTGATEPSFSSSIFGHWKKTLAQPSKPEKTSSATAITLEKAYDTIKDSERLEDWEHFINEYGERDSPLLIGARAKVYRIKNEAKAAREAETAAQREKQAKDVWRHLDGVDYPEGVLDFFKKFIGTEAHAEAVKKGVFVTEVGSGTNSNLRVLKPGDSFKDADLGPEMVVVPAGEFLMGEENNTRPVAIEQPFAVARYATTFDEWDAAVAAGGVKHKPGDEGWGRGRRPVINVSWQNAKEYAAWLSEITGKSYRLLSEAEWEYACRAGTKTKYSFGNTITKQQAQFSSQQTVKVGSFPPNDWGLYDMHGNVWEWCEDEYDSSSRVLRGGSWNYDPEVLRSASRDHIHPDIRDLNVGFRLARTLLLHTP